MKLIKKSNHYGRQFYYLIIFYCAICTVYAEDKIVLDCSHRTTPFVFTEFMDRAEVIGSKNARLYIYKQNPDLCAAEKLSECTSKQYVITGDQVIIGNSCGEWSHIQFKKTEGWVKSNGLKLLNPSEEILNSRNKWLLTRKDYKDSPIVQAIISNDVTQLNGLIKAENDYIYALQMAAVMKNTDAVRAILNMEIFKGVLSNNCELMNRAVHSNPEIVKALLDKGAMVNCTAGSEKYSPLLSLSTEDPAAEQVRNRMGILNPVADDPEGIVKLLVSHGADLNIKAAWDTTPLQDTLRLNNVKMAKILIAAGADVNNVRLRDGGVTILMNAISYYPLHMDSSIIRLLLENGANVNFRNELDHCDQECSLINSGIAGSTALIQAASKGYDAVVKLLLQYGADPTITRTDGATPAEVARSNGHEKTASVIEAYIKSKSTINPSADDKK